MASLTEETRQALLASIKAAATDERRADQLERLSTAFAFTVGAFPQRLPGYTPPSS